MKWEEHRVHSPCDCGKRERTTRAWWQHSGARGRNRPNRAVPPGGRYGTGCCSECYQTRPTPGWWQPGTKGKPLVLTVSLQWQCPAHKRNPHSAVKHYKAGQARLYLNLRQPEVRWMCAVVKGCCCCCERTKREMWISKFSLLIPKTGKRFMFFFFSDFRF